MEKSLKTNEIIKSVLLFLIGFFGYGIIEIWFRGYTHWSMRITGGACLLTLYYLNQEFKSAPLITKAMGGALIITLYEFAVGVIVNLIFNFNVWDYSELPFHFLGQICPLFTFLWFVLCLALLIISNILYRASRYLLP
ncbi:MAG: putative ABC transporter permease [Aminipila sp.]